MHRNAFLGLILITAMLFLLTAVARSTAADLLEKKSIAAGMLMSMGRSETVYAQDFFSLRVLFSGLGARIFTTKKLSEYLENDALSLDQAAANIFSSDDLKSNILFGARLPFILMAVGAGWMFFSWSKKRFGKRSALIFLFLYAFSIPVLVYSYSASGFAAVMLAFGLLLIFLLRFFQKSSWWNTLYAGVFLGMAQLMGLPLLSIALVSIILLLGKFISGKAKGIFLKIDNLAKLIVIYLAGVIIVWAGYGYIILAQNQNYLLFDNGKAAAAIRKTSSDSTTFTEATNKYQTLLAPLYLYLNNLPDNYTAGNYSGKDISFIYSLPVFRYITKESIPVYIFVLLAVIQGVKRINKSRRVNPRKKHRVRRWIRENFIMFGLLTAVLTSAAISFFDNYRQLEAYLIFPVLPLSYILVSVQVSRWLRKVQVELGELESWRLKLKFIWKGYALRFLRWSLIIALIGWHITDTILALPNLSAFTNIIFSQFFT